ncbi:MAG: sensor histidine kinase [Candidatus Methylacidiphilales bacterium]|nr:HAMP domain-containing sensor histidine kinase [Candidatus Methylacidiphilales bacterium]
MKTRFPLFARLLLWFFVNVAVVLIALFLTIRFQFATQFRGFLPDTSRPQTQAMAEVLIHELSTTPKEHWDQLLATNGTAYHMEFALYGKGGERMAGPEMMLPPDADSVIRMTVGQGPPPQRGDPRGANGGPLPGFFPVGAGGPGGGPGPGANGRILPEFPQRVIRTEHPETFWLMIHLPLDRLQIEGLSPMMLVGRTNRPTETPLLFNPNPWLYLAAGTIVFSSLYWLLLTRNLTQVIARMTNATEEIAEGRFDVHTSEARSDELGRLGLAINRMASRLKGFVTGQRRFLGDVAHELCSPLARMEVALSILEERADPRAQSYVTDVREEVTHMRKLAHELLSFSKASLAGPHIGLRSISVAETIAEAVRQEHCQDGQVQVAVPANLRVSAQPDLLCRAISNLLRNAIRYAGHAGPISVAAWKEGADLIISVADQGPGVPERELERLFDPFFRLDESRASDTGGTGLGLAIVKTCVEACHGTVTASNRMPTGLEVQLRFRDQRDAGNSVAATVEKSASMSQLNASMANSFELKKSV